MSKEKNFKDKAEDIINDVKDSTKDFSKKEISDGKGMAVLSYIIPIIPYFVEKKNKFAIYHAKQGMNLLMVCIAYGFVNAILSSLIKVNTSCGNFLGYNLDCKVTPWWVSLPLGLIGVVIGIIAIFGIVYAVGGKAKELPLVNKVKIFK